MKLIEKELERSKAADHELKEVKLLLDSNHAEDINILRGLSRNSEINVLERNRGDRLQLENLDNSWNGSVYSLNDIKKLCIHYRLRFLSSQYYKGKFDTQVVSKLKQFSIEQNLVLSSDVLNRKFFILAPPEMFSTEQAKFVSKKQKDPVLFFQVGDNAYKKIHVWGSDFTLFRRILGWKWENVENEYAFNFSLLFCALILAFSFIFPFFIYNHYVWVPIISAVVSTIVTFGLVHTDDSKQIDEFFTPHNWNSTTKLTR